MTFEQNSALPKRFVTSTLPLLIGLAAALVYFATMSRWATVNSIGIVSRASGWVWQPELHQPLAFVLYLPFRFLPEQMIPLALNSFNALLAALTVTLLARAVTLLPHDRTSDQRDLVGNEHSVFISKFSWIPPVLAALVLGLQISFWENATAVSAEIIDVFVVAYVVRCLLEFRIDDRQSWMSRAAFIYALGITNNWALIGLAPFFLVAIVWIKGFSFFNLGFILRIFAFGLAGLLLYLLLPLIYIMSTSGPVEFWPVFKANMVGQKQTLAGVYYFFKDNYRFVVVGATSVLPLFFIGLKWRSSFGDTSPIGIFITKAVFHIAHALFFVVCLLVVLSPPYSPRQLLPGLPFLNHTYFSALVVGYCAGYFLLICSPALRSRARMHSLLRLTSYLALGGVVVVLIIIPLALVARNWEPVKLTNGGLLNPFMAQSLSPLPDAPATIVSDDPARLALVRSFLIHRGDAGKYLFYDTKSAAYSDYHAAQLRTQGERWPSAFATLTNRAEISPLGLLSFFGELVKTGPVFYLEPSFGYYFEHFELSPRGMIFEAAAYATNAIMATPLTPEMTETNQGWWSEFDATLLPILEQCLPSEDAPRMRPKWQSFLYQKLKLSDEQVPTAEVIAKYASRTANDWGVELQKQGLWPEAAAAYKRALILSEDNVVARINLDYNEARQAGKPAPTSVAASIEDEFGRYQDWNQVMAACGPFDEPRFTFEQGRTFFSGKLYRQALQHIARVIELEPHHYIANVWLADLYAMLGRPDEALKIVAQVRSQPSVFSLDGTKELNLDRLEATALFRAGEKEKARDILLKAINKPDVGTVFRATAAQLLLQAGLNAEALPLLDEVATEHPTDVRTLANLGYANLQLANYDRARAVLTSALELDPKNSVVRLNRAITLLRAKQYDAAREDYLILQQEFPKAYQVQFGLGEIAVANNNSAAAAAYFEECMKLTPVGTPDYVEVSNRLSTVRAEIK